MTEQAYKRTKYACFYTYVAMASIFVLPPLLFVTFREMYGISYTLLGTLVLINFCTQLTVDLLFTFFTSRFNIHKTIKIMPLLTSLGLIVYALFPVLFPKIAYVGLAVGTVVFSVAAGLCEVLLSPLVAALPSKTPEKDMSLLHSLYAWGILIVIVLSTVFLHFIGREKWMYLTLFWALLPLVSCFLFCTSPLPPMDLSQQDSKAGAGKKHLGILLCVGCIFLGSAAENSMTNWISVYVASALGVPKMLGDILGMAMFALLLGIVRVMHAKYGWDIFSVLFYSMIGAAICYLTVSFSPSPILSMIACILTGLFTSMLWPGTLILMEEKFPHSGVAAYALMAAGGDFGASVAPQLLGVVVDKVSVSSWGVQLAASFALSPEQIGMKSGMLMAALFPVLGVLLLIYMKKYFKKNGSLERSNA